MLRPGQVTALTAGLNDADQHRESTRTLRPCTASVRPHPAPPSPLGSVPSSFSSSAFLCHGGSLLGGRELLLEFCSRCSCAPCKSPRSFTDSSRKGSPGQPTQVGFIELQKVVSGKVHVLGCRAVPRHCPGLARGSCHARLSSSPSGPAFCRGV
jgi:hypothetical protein